MTDRKLDSRQLRAVRLIRAGSPVEQVCKTLRLPVASISSLESACRNVPDEILERLERALSDNEKLRRLVAGLVGPMLADDPATGRG